MSMNELTTGEKQRLLTKLKGSRNQSISLEYICDAVKVKCALARDFLACLTGLHWNVEDAEGETKIIRLLEAHLVNADSIENIRAKRVAELADAPRGVHVAHPAQKLAVAAFAAEQAAPAGLVCCQSPLPTDSAARKEIPLWEGVMAYFPAALVAAARVSHLGNQKHNPGEELHHARGKSMDHTDCIARHLVDYQALKAQAHTAAEGSWAGCSAVSEAEEHLGNLAWRVLAYVQTELEGMGRAPLPPRARKAVAK
jgi:hypothetical protein